MALQEDIHEIKELLKSNEADKEKVKVKKFKIPFKGRVSPKKASQGYVTIMKINENGFVDFIKQPIKEQTTMVDGIPRLASPNYVLHWGKNPMLIQPSWSVKPFSPEDQFNKSLNDGSNTKGYPILLARMKSDTTSGIKKEMGSMVKWILGLGLVGIIAYAFITGGG